MGRKKKEKSLKEKTVDKILKALRERCGNDLKEFSQYLNDLANEFPLDPNVEYVPIWDDDKQKFILIEKIDTEEKQEKQKR